MFANKKGLRQNVFRQMNNNYSQKVPEINWNALFYIYYLGGRRANKFSSVSLNNLLPQTFPSMILFSNVPRPKCSHMRQNIS